jgi:hypothetical protein
LVHIDDCFSRKQYFTPAIGVWWYPIFSRSYEAGKIEIMYLAASTLSIFKYPEKRSPEMMDVWGDAARLPL